MQPPDYGFKKQTNLVAFLFFFPSPPNWNANIQLAWILPGMLISGYKDEDHIALWWSNRTFLDQSCLKNLTYLLLDYYVRKK